MVKLASFDFGWSFVYEQPVSTVLLDRLGTTLMLMAASLSIAFTAGIALGAIAARRAYSATDNLISVLGLVFYATPSFFLSLMLMLVFSVKLGWLPVVAQYLVFIGILASEIARGAESCGCVGGNIDVPPVVMLCVDAALLLGLLVTRGRRRRQWLN